MVKRGRKNKGKNFLLIFRSDSTLRGHYPLETETIYNELKRDEEIDGEIIIPFFLEGGRFTFNDIHYVKEREMLVPTGQNIIFPGNVGTDDTLKKVVEILRK